MQSAGSGPARGSSLQCDRHLNIAAGRTQGDAEAAVIGFGLAIAATGGVGVGGVKHFVEFGGHGVAFEECPGTEAE